MEDESSEGSRIFNDVDEDVIVFSIDLQLIDLPFKLKNKIKYEYGYSELTFDVAIDKRSKKIVNVEYQSVLKDKVLESSLGHYDYHELCYEFFRLDAVEDLVSRFLMQFYKMENETFTRLESVESDMGLIIFPSQSIRSGESVAELIKNFKGF